MREIDKMGDEGGAHDVSHATAQHGGAEDVAGDTPHHGGTHSAKPAADEVPQWSFSFLHISKCVPLPTFRSPLNLSYIVGHPMLTNKQMHHVMRCGSAPFCCIIARSILRSAAVVLIFAHL